MINDDIILLVSLMCFIGWIAITIIGFHRYSSKPEIETLHVCRKCIKAGGVQMLQVGQEAVISDIHPCNVCEVK